MEQSALQMILQAGYVVKSVLIILPMFSITSSTIIFYKWRLFSKADDENATFMEIYNMPKSPKDVYTSSKKFELSPLARLFKSVYSEKAYTDKQELGRMLKRYGALESARLAEAIPAVIAYNYNLSRVNRMIINMDDYSEELGDYILGRSL